MRTTELFRENCVYSSTLVEEIVSGEVGASNKRKIATATIRRNSWEFEGSDFRVSGADSARRDPGDRAAKARVFP